MEIKKAILIVTATLSKESLSDLEKDAMQTLLNDSKLYKYLKICPVCKTRFFAKRVTTVYCSGRCSQKQWNVNLKKDPKKLAKRRESMRIAARNRRRKKKVE